MPRGTTRLWLFSLRLLEKQHRGASSYKSFFKNKNSYGSDSSHVMQAHSASSTTARQAVAVISLPKNGFSVQPLENYSSKKISESPYDKIEWHSFKDDVTLNIVTENYDGYPGLNEEDLATIVEINFSEFLADEISFIHLGEIRGAFCVLELGNVTVYKFMFVREGLAYTINLRTFSNKSVRYAKSQMLNLIKKIKFIPVEGRDETLPSPHYNRKWKGRGYDVDLRGSKWMVDEQGDQLWPGCDKVFHAHSLAHLVFYSFKYDPNRISVLGMMTAIMNTFGVVCDERTVSKHAHKREDGAYQFEMEHQAGDEGASYIRNFKICESGGYYVVSIVNTHERFSDLIPLGQDVQKRMTFRGVPDSYINDKSQRQFLAECLNQYGLNAYTNGQHHQAQTLIHKAHQLNPDHFDISKNLVDVYIETGAWSKADKILRDIDNSLLAGPSWLTRKARVAYHLEKKDQCIQYLDRYFQELPRDDIFFSYFMNVLVEVNDPLSISSWCSSYEKKYPNQGIKALCLYYKHKTGIESFNSRDYLKILEQNKDNAQLADDILNHVYELSEDEALLETCDWVLDHMGRHHFVYFYQAQVHLRVQHFDKAKASIERAIELEPRSELYQGLHMRILSMMGQGVSVGVVNHQMTPLPLPTSFIIDADLEARDYIKDASAHYSYYYELFHYKKNKALKKTIYLKVKIHKSGGLERFNQFIQKYQPSRERIHIHRFDVLDEDGVNISSFKPSDVYTQDDLSSGLETLHKNLKINSTGLRVGAFIEAVFVIENLYPEDSFPFTEFLMNFDLPVLRYGAQIAGDVADLKVKSYNCRPRMSKDRISVYKEKLIRYKPYDYMPNHEDFMPVVRIGDGSKSWKQLGDEYMASIDDIIEDREMLKPWLESIAIDDSSDSSIVTSIVQEIQKSFSYIGIEFGMRGIVPAKCSKTILNRYGDCKDFSLLLHRALSYHGIESHLALAVANHKKCEADLPSLGQFNHMVVLVRYKEGWRVIDPTAKYLSPKSCPLSLFDKHVLRLQKVGTELIIPIQTEHLGDVISVQRTLSSFNQHFQVKEKISLKHHIAESYRAYFKSSEQDAFDLVQRIYNPVSDIIEVTDVRLENLERTDLDLIMDVQYRYRLKHEDRPPFAFQPVVVWEQNFLLTHFGRERPYPFLIKSPTQLTTEWMIDGLTWHDDRHERQINFPESEIHKISFRSLDEGSPDRRYFYFNRMSGGYLTEDYRSSYMSVLKSLRELKRPMTLE